MYTLHIGLTILLTHPNVWESMGKPCSCTQSFLLQVMHTASECAMIRMTKPYIVSSYRGKKYHLFAAITDNRDSIWIGNAYTQCIA